MHSLICTFVVRIWHKTHFHITWPKCMLTKMDIWHGVTPHWSYDIKYINCVHSLLDWDFMNIIRASLWKSGGYTGFALSFRNSMVLSFSHSVIIQMKLEYLSWLMLILYEASLGWGKCCVRFWDRLDQNSGFHGNRKCPLTYNGENDSTFPLLFFYQIFFKLACNKDRHDISDEFEFQPDRTTSYRVRCPWVSEKFPIDLEWENSVSKLTCSYLIGSSSNLLVIRTGIILGGCHFGVKCPWGRIKFSIDILWNLQVQLTFQTLEFFVTLFSGTVRPRKKLKLGQWADVSCKPESGCCCLFIPLFLHFSFSPIFNIEHFRHRFLGNCEA